MAISLAIILYLSSKYLEKKKPQQYHSRHADKNEPNNVLARVCRKRHKLKAIK